MIFIKELDDILLYYIILNYQVVQVQQTGADPGQIK